MYRDTDTINWSLLIQQVREGITEEIAGYSSSLIPRKEKFKGLKSGIESL